MRKTPAQIVAALFFGAAFSEFYRILTGRESGFVILLSGLFFIFMVRYYFGYKDRKNASNSFNSIKESDNDLLDN